MHDLTAVRPGEELDSVRLAAWLAERGIEGRLEIEQFSLGFSNLTYLLRAGERELVLRRPPIGSRVRTAHDMSREHRILSALRPVFEKVPRTVAFCDDPDVLGAPFYLMERVPGTILRGRAVEASSDAMRALSEAFVDTLVEIHGVDLFAAGLSDLGRPEGYVERQVRGWTERYAKSRTDEIEAMDAVAAWLAAHLPVERGACLIHNDYKYDNLVLDPRDFSRIRAVLDWEMATVGDPLMDLGTSLAYWVEADDPPALKALPFGPTVQAGNLTRAEIVARYAEKSGRAVDGISFYYAFGLYKIAVVAQQIYARYKQGLTRDERFAHLLGAIRVLADTARASCK
jgi:aminoglycoside phosphotransferase (APT) family kinase protein